MTSICLLGGAGFLGSNLIRYRRYLGTEDITVIDNLATSNREFVPPYVKFIEADVVTLTESAKGAISEADVVYFLPALPAYKDIIADPQANLWIHSVGLLNVLKVVKDEATVIFASSSHIYGTTKWGEVVSEKDTGSVHPLEPLGPYQEAKRFAESLLWSERGRIGVGIARIFNTYGPWGSQDGRVMERFILSALANKPIDVYGEHDVRSYCYAKDTVKALVRLENFVSENGPLCVNIGSDVWIENKDLAELVKRLTESESPILNHPRRRGDLGWRCPDIKLARDKLGWKPETSLEEGVVQSIEWWRTVSS